MHSTEGLKVKLLVQPIRCGTKWGGLDMARVVMGLNGVVAGQSSKIEAWLSRNQSGVGRLERGHKGEGADKRD